MNNRKVLIAIATIMGVLILPRLSIVAQQSDDEPPEMGFFVSSVSIGDGGNLGGLAGADAHCQSLATAAGAFAHAHSPKINGYGWGDIMWREGHGCGEAMRVRLREMSPSS